MKMILYNEQQFNCVNEVMIEPDLKFIKNENATSNNCTYCNYHIFYFV